MSVVPTRCASLTLIFFCPYDLLLGPDLANELVLVVSAGFLLAMALLVSSSSVLYETTTWCAPNDPNPVQVMVGIEVVG